MHLQDEGAAGGEQQAAEQQQEQPEVDAEFQYMHEDEGPAAGDTQVRLASAS